jgi:hypothetical protein
LRKARQQLPRHRDRAVHRRPELIFSLCPLAGTDEQS